MRLKDIAANYKVEKFEKDSVILYSLTENGMRSPLLYLATAKKVSTDKYQIDGYEPTRDIEQLKKDVESYRKTLPYSSEYYHPRFVKGTAEWLIIHDYLKSIGFEFSNMYNNIEIYSCANKNIYGGKREAIVLSVINLRPNHHFENDKLVLDNQDQIEVCLHTSKYSIAIVKCDRNIDEIKKAIDGLVKPLLISNSISDFSSSEKLTNSDVEILLTKFNDKNLDTVTEAYKGKLLNSLKSLVAALETT